MKNLMQDETLKFYIETLTDKLDEHIQDLTNTFKYDGHTLEITFRCENSKSWNEIVKAFDETFASVERISKCLGYSMFYTNKGIEQDTEWWYNFCDNVDTIITLK